jgi:hypothetical protein
MWRVGLAGPTSATAAGYGPGSVVRQSQGTRLIALGNFDAIDASKHHQDLVLHLTGAASTTADWQSAFDETACAKAFNSYVRDLDFSPDGSFFVVATTGAYGLHRTGLATARAVPTGTLAPGNVRGAFMLNGCLYMAWSNGTFHRRTFDGTNCGVAEPVDTSSKLTALTDWSSDISAMTGLFYDSGRLYFTRSGSSTLYYRYFTPENKVVGAQRPHRQHQRRRHRLQPGPRHVRRRRHDRHRQHRQPRVRRTGNPRGHPEGSPTTTTPPSRGPGRSGPRATVGFVAAASTNGNRHSHGRAAGATQVGDTLLLACGRGPPPRRTWARGRPCQLLGVKASGTASFSTPTGQAVRSGSVGSGSGAISADLTDSDRPVAPGSRGRADTGAPVTRAAMFPVVIAAQ